MDCYRVLIRKTAEKELRKIPKNVLKLVTAKISRLSDNPRPMGSEKLSGEDRYRIRQSDWRIVYGIHDEHRIVEIIKIGHRSEVYR